MCLVSLSTQGVIFPKLIDKFLSFLLLKFHGDDLSPSEKICIWRNNPISKRYTVCSGRGLEGNNWVNLYNAPNVACNLRTN